MAFVQHDEGILCQRTNEAAAVGRLALDRVHLVIGAENDVERLVGSGAVTLQVRHLLLVKRAGCAAQEFAAALWRLGAVDLRLLGRVIPSDRIIIEGYGHTGIGQERPEVTAKHLRHTDVVHIANDVAVEIWLLGDKDRSQAFTHGVAQCRCHNAAFANAGLIADDKSGAFLHVVDCHGDGVDLLGREILGDFTGLVAKFLFYPCVEVAVLVGKALQRCLDCISHIRWDFGVERWQARHWTVWLLRRVRGLRLLGYALSGGTSRLAISNADVAACGWYFISTRRGR